MGLADNREENGDMVIILPDADWERLRILADFLYTGSAFFIRDEIVRISIIEEDFYSLLAKQIQVCCTNVMQLKEMSEASGKCPVTAPDEIEFKVPLEENQDELATYIDLQDLKLVQNFSDENILPSETNSAEKNEEKLKTKARSWKCTVCPNSYKQKSHLTRHQQRSHPYEDLRLFQKNS